MMTGVSRGAVDFRLRPPAGGFLHADMFANTRRSAGKAADIGSRLPESARKASMPLLIGEMDRAGIEVGVLTGRVNSVLGTVENQDLADIVARYPDRFVALAGVDVSDRRQARDEVDAAVRQGFRGISIEPGLRPDPWSLDDPRLYPLYAHCEARGVLTLVMSGGNAGPDVAYSHPAAIDRVARDFPELVIVAGHGNWPWASEIIHVCYRRANVYLSPDVYLNPSLPGAREYVDAANGFMADRFLFGSAYPFCALDDAVQFMYALPFRPDVRDRVLRRNARRLLGLDASEGL